MKNKTQLKQRTIFSCQLWFYKMVHKITTLGLFNFFFILISTRPIYSDNQKEDSISIYTYITAITLTFDFVFFSGIGKRVSSPNMWKKSLNNLCGDLNKGSIPANPMNQNIYGTPYPL